MMGCPFAPHGNPWGFDTPPTEFFFLDEEGDLWPVCQYDPETGEYGFVGLDGAELA